MVSSHDDPGTRNDPQAAGAAIHRVSGYDILSYVLGMGPKGRNSRMVIELAEIKPGDSVLDLGCGTGSLTLTARRAVGPSGKVHGIDASPEMIDAARQKASRSGLDVLFDVGLMEDLGFPDGTFDVLISRLAIHHLPDDLKPRGFAEFLRVLKPGGHLLIADFTPPANRWLRRVASAIVDPHMMQPALWNLPPMLASAGFAEITSGRTRSAFLGFVCAKKPEN